MYSLAPSNGTKPTRTPFTIQIAPLRFLAERFLIRINSTTLSRTSIERWHASGEESVFTLELHKRGCILDPKDDSWTCKFK